MLKKMKGFCEKRSVPCEIGIAVAVCWLIVLASALESEWDELLHDSP